MRTIYHLLYEKAIKALQTGNDEEAKQLLDQFLYLEPNNPLGHIGLGLYHQSHDIITAEKHFQAAHELDPELIHPLILLGNVAYQRTKYHEAIGYFERALKLNRELPEAYRGIAYCYDKLNDTSNALRYYEQFI